MRERVAAGRKLAEAIRASLPVRDPSGGRQRRPPASSAAAQVRANMWQSATLSYRNARAVVTARQQALCSMQTGEREQPSSVSATLGMMTSMRLWLLIMHVTLTCLADPISLPPSLGLPEVVRESGCFCIHCSCPDRAAAGARRRRSCGRRR